MATIQELLGTSYKEGMTLEDVTTALAGITLPDGKEIDRLKNAVNKATSEAANFRREKEELEKKLNAGDATHSTQVAELQKTIETMQRKSDIADYKATLISQGYEAALAEETAVAMVDKDFAKILENQQKFLQAHDQAMTAKRMKDNPRPGASGNNGNNTRDFGKEIETARANGDMARVAHLIREQHEENAKNNTN